MKRRLVALAAALALAVGGAAGADAQRAPTTVLKPCSSGWVHASLSWGHKCLRAGQFCKRSGDREYHRYGFHCHGQRLTR
jgi:hypothetical protein